MYNIDKNGLTALHNAVYKGHEEIVRLLIDNGADVTGMAGVHHIMLFTQGT